MSGRRALLNPDQTGQAKSNSISFSLTTVNTIPTYLTDHRPSTRSKTRTMSSDGDLDNSFVFDLSRDNEGGFYRVPMTNDGDEANRPVMVNRGEKFQVVAELLDVVHGTVEDGGDDATLLIASFYFLPSGQKRFVEAAITWAFTSDDPAVKVAVDKIAPAGTWSLAPVRRSEEKSLTAKANVGPAHGPVTATIGGEFGMKQEVEIDYHTTVTGAKRMVNRDKGGHDGVRWTLEENKVTKGGICRMLQVGILLRRTILKGKTPKPDPKFRGEVDVVVGKGGWSEAASKAKAVWKKLEKDEAIIFQPGIDRKSGSFDIDATKLNDLDLQADVMFMSLHESFDDLRKQREERAKKKREEEEEEAKKQQLAAPVSIPGLPVPPWVFFVAAGVIGMYLLQHLTAIFFGGN